MRTWLALALAVMMAPVAAISRAQQSPLPSSKLDPKIPAPILAVYKDIRDGMDWRNPALHAGVDGIRVTSTSLRDARTVSVSELGDLLVRLPVSDWPYGRVVMMSWSGPRPAGESAAEAIRQNVAAAQQVLATLDVTVDAWP